MTTAGFALLRTVPPGKALLIHKRRRTDVSFSGAVVLPVLHRAELMDISVRSFTLARTGPSHLLSGDGVPTELTMTFYVHVNRTAGDVVKVARAIGARHLDDVRTIESLFTAKFTEAMRAAVRRKTYLEHHDRPAELRDDVLDIIGRDLAGFHLDDAAIDSLNQAPPPP